MCLNTECAVINSGSLRLTLHYKTKQLRTDRVEAKHKGGETKAADHQLNLRLLNIYVCYVAPVL